MAKKKRINPGMGRPTSNWVTRDKLKAESSKIRRNNDKAVIEEELEHFPEVWEIVYVGGDNDSWGDDNEFPSEAAANTAIQNFYDAGGIHDDPYGEFVAIKKNNY